MIALIKSKYQKHVPETLNGILCRVHLENKKFFSSGNFNFYQKVRENKIGK